VTSTTTTHLLPLGLPTAQALAGPLPACPAARPSVYASATDSQIAVQVVANLVRGRPPAPARSPRAPSPPPPLHSPAKPGGRQTRAVAEPHSPQPSGQRSWPPSRTRVRPAAHAEGLGGLPAASRRVSRILSGKVRELRSLPPYRGLLTAPLTAAKASLTRA